MVLEYLFLDDKYKKVIEKYHYTYDVISKGKVTRQITPEQIITSITNSNSWTISYKLNGNGEDEAKHLSIIHEYIMANYNPLTLVNDSSSYFNKILFPLVNEFERKLRAFLYLKSIHCPEEKVNKFIKELERTDFGKIHDFFFADPKFCANARELTKNLYSQEEVIEKLKDLTEETCWDNTFGKNYLKYLKDNFWKMKDYRNSVMHAHNMDYVTFIKAKEMYKESIHLLNIEINDLIAYPESKEDSEMFSSNVIEEFVKNSVTAIKTLTSPEFERTMKQLSNTIDLYSNIPVMPIDPKVIEGINKFIQAYYHSSESNKGINEE